MVQISSGRHPDQSEALSSLTVLYSFELRVVRYHIESRCGRKACPMCGILYPTLWDIARCDAAAVRTCHGRRSTPYVPLKFGYFLDSDGGRLRQTAAATQARLRPLARGHPRPTCEASGRGKHDETAFLCPAPLTVSMACAPLGGHAGRRIRSGASVPSRQRSVENHGLTGLPVLLRMEQERSTEYCVEIDMKDTGQAIHGAVKLEIRPNSTVRITESW